LILGYGAITDDYDPELGYGALTKASQYGNTEIVKLLLENGATEYELIFALEDATNSGYFDIVKLLVEAGATDIQGTARLASVAGSHILQYFIDQGIDINYQYEFDNYDSNYTLLMFATINMNKKGIEALLDAGADTTLTNHEGQTALDFAMKAGSKDIVELLEKHKG
jgi:ankyrin repeat protein